MLLLSTKYSRYVADLQKNAAPGINVMVHRTYLPQLNHLPALQKLQDKKTNFLRSK